MSLDILMSINYSYILIKNMIIICRKIEENNEKTIKQNNNNFFKNIYIYIFIGQLDRTLVLAYNSNTMIKKHNRIKN